MNKNLIKYGLVAIASSIIGFYTSSFEYFKFNSEINIVDFSSLLISSLIGLFIAITVQRNLTNEKTEKDLLIGEINQIKNDLKTIYNSVLIENVDFNDTVFTFKLISSNLSNLEDLFEICNTKHNNQINNILQSVTNLKRFVTDSPLQNDKLIISEENKSNFFIEYKKLTKLFFKIIIEVNRK